MRPYSRMCHLCNAVCTDSSHIFKGLSTLLWEMWQVNHVLYIALANSVFSIQKEYMVWPHSVAMKLCTNVVENKNTSNYVGRANPLWTKVKSVQWPLEGRLPQHTSPFASKQKPDFDIWKYTHVLICTTAQHTKTHNYIIVYTHMHVALASSTYWRCHPNLH